MVPSRPPSSLLVVLAIGHAAQGAIILFVRRSRTFRFGQRSTRRTASSRLFPRRAPWPRPTCTSSSHIILIISRRRRRRRRWKPKKKKRTKKERCVRLASVSSASFPASASHGLTTCGSGPFPFVSCLLEPVVADASATSRLRLLVFPMSRREEWNQAPRRCAQAPWAAGTPHKSRCTLGGWGRDAWRCTPGGCRCTRWGCGRGMATQCSNYRDGTRHTWSWIIHCTHVDGVHHHHHNPGP